MSTLKNFLIETFKYSDDRSTLLARSVKDSKKQLESLDELRVNPDLLKRAGLIDNEIREFKLKVNQYQISLIQFDSFLIESELNLSKEIVEQEENQQTNPDFSEQLFMSIF